MSKTKNKKATKRDGDGAARESGPAQYRRKFTVGDRVRIVDIPKNTKDPKVDLKSPGAREMRTAELFCFCLGRVFTIYGFGRYGHAELRVGKSYAVKKKFGWSDTIWIGPEFLRRVSRQRLKARFTKE